MKYNAMTATANSSQDPLDDRGYDKTYSLRHPRRNRRKAKAILRGLPEVPTILDVGCNAGIYSDRLLQRSPTCRVTGVDLSPDALDTRLLGNDRFTFLQGDVADIELSCRYDAVLYLAVHHHVFARRGKETAIRTLEKLLARCNRFFIFESGILSEEGNWYWKEALAHYYLSDDGIYQELFTLAGARLKRVHTIAKLPIHGVVRPIVMLELDPITAAEAQEFPLPACDMDLQLLEWFQRTAGSRSQALIPTGSAHAVYAGTHFSLLQDAAGGARYFGKLHTDSISKPWYEAQLHSEVRHPRIVPALSHHPEYGLVFPFCPYRKFSDLDPAEISNSRQFLGELRDFHNEARRIELSISDRDSPEKMSKIRLIDAVDLHPANLLVDVMDGVVRDWKFVDMELYARHNRIRNLSHLLAISRVLGGGMEWQFRSRAEQAARLKRGIEVWFAKTFLRLYPVR